MNEVTLTLKAQFLEKADEGKIKDVNCTIADNYPDKRRRLLKSFQHENVPHPRHVL